MLPEAVQHLADKVILVHTVPDWSRRALDRANAKGPHASACIHEMTAFIHGELQYRVRDGFSILFSVADAVRLFVGKLEMSCIAVVPQEHRSLWLILNLSEQP